MQTLPLAAPALIVRIAAARCAAAANKHCALSTQDPSRKWWVLFFMREWEFENYFARNTTSHVNRISYFRM